MRPCVFRPPDFLRPVVSAFSGSLLVTSARSLQVAKRRPGLVGLWRLTAISEIPSQSGTMEAGKQAVTDEGFLHHLLPNFLALEELDVVVGMQLDDRLLPRAALAGRVAAALRLRLHAHRAHLDHAHAEDLLNGLADLRLVRVVVDAERVLVRREQRVALLGDDRLDDHGAGVHALTASREGFRAIVLRYSTAAGVSTSRCAPMMSATPTRSSAWTTTPERLRNDLRHVSPSRPSTTSVRPGSPNAARPSAARLADGASKSAGSTTASEPRRRCSDSTARSARRRALRLTLTV